MYIRKTFDLKISDSLRALLCEIESQSEVAKMLLKSRLNKEDLVDSPVNFISISSQDRTKISYITEERLSQIPEDEIWTSQRRFQVKPGGFISKLFKNVSPAEVEKFSNLFRSEATKPKLTFKVVSGSDIKKYYNVENYENGGGSLGNSCMKYTECQKFFKLYTDNPVKMLIMLNEDDYLIGRALLWDANLDGKSKRIMDRIYTTNDEYFSFYFKKWANENGYFYKSSQTWYNTLFFESDKQKRVEMRLQIHLNESDFDYYPYMDTFKFLDDNGNLYNYQPKGINYKTLSSPDGCQSSSNYLRFDEIDKYFRYSGDCVYLRYLDIYTHHERCNYSDIFDCYILSKDAIYQSDIDDYIYSDEYDSHNNNELIAKRRESLGKKEKTRKSSFELYMNEMLNREISQINFTTEI